MMMGCGRFSETKWQDHLLETPSANLESHLRTCITCWEEMAELQATISAVEQTPLSHAAVRTSFADQVLADVGFTQNPHRSRPQRRRMRLRWPQPMGKMVPLLTGACIAFLLLWTGAGGLDVIFPVKQGTPITQSSVTFQVASDFEARFAPASMAEASGFAADSQISTFAAEPTLENFAFEAEGFTAVPDDPAPMAMMRTMSFVAQTTPLAVPDGVTNVIMAGAQRGWSLSRVPDAEPIRQPAGITTKRVVNDTF